MLFALLAIYLGLILGTVITTVLLIFCGYGWGPLPHIYIRLIIFFQSFYPHMYPRSDLSWPGILRRCEASSLEKHRNDSLSSFKFSETTKGDLFDVCADAFKAGFEAVAQDQISVAFDSAPPYHTTLLNTPGLLPFPDAPRLITHRQYFGYLLSIVFRYGVLFPIRLNLIIISFIFSLGAVILVCFIDLTDQQKTHIGVVYSRIFSAGTGLVARYHQRENRPKRPGIAVANHLSPNDVHIIYADADPNSSSGFTITGQRHGGIICAIERIVEKVCPTVWLDRKRTEDRHRFMDEVLNEGRNAGPVLLFPEGYCTNNTRVLQFRQAVFEDDINIYPIAIRQNARFGDNFWYEERFWKYMLRVLTSWAIVYDVTYLEPQRKQLNETKQNFAARVQKMIAKCAKLEAIEFDGRLWYKKEESERMKTVQIENIAKRFKEKLKVKKSKKYLANSDHEFKRVESRYLSTTFAYDGVFVQS